jgi:hypothetical protein
MEWAWKLKSERSCLIAPELLVSFGTSPVIEDRISCNLTEEKRDDETALYPAMRASLSPKTKQKKETGRESE